MTPATWQDVYTELTDYIARYPEIRIESEYTCLPDNVRSEFYRLFNGVRTTYLKEKCSGLLEEATTLSKHYLEAENELRALLKLENITMAPALQIFLSDPAEALIRVLFDPLFDLLKGKITELSFEHENPGKVERYFRLYYQTGYEKWAIISLLNRLQADRLFQMTARKVFSETEAKLMFSQPDEPIPDLVESRELNFNDNSPITLELPDLIIHSASLNKYISLRSAIGKPMSFTSQKTGVRKWLDFDYFDYMWLGSTLLYVADTPGEIALIADSDKICQPDLILQCRYLENWNERKAWEHINTQQNKLQPLFGTIVLTCCPTSGQPMINNISGISLLTPAFFPLKLSPIIEILKQSTRKDIKTSSNPSGKLETIHK
jgi:hypothetical protein